MNMEKEKEFWIKNMRTNCDNLGVDPLYVESFVGILNGAMNAAERLTVTRKEEEFREKLENYDIQLPF